ncbi:MAG TPA: hypothetical protein VEK76_07735 [Candidatus Binatia bacterium]|nr:hypothetical protein [Candidatus Binatia bacterium]
MLDESGPAADAIAFLILLDDAPDAAALASLLAGAWRGDAAVPALVLTPPVRGLGFFADEERQAELDAWWSAHVPRSAHPIYLLLDAPGLEEWLPGVDGTFYIGVRERDRLATFASLAGRRVRAEAILCSGPLDLAAVVMHDLSGVRGGRLALFDSAEALGMAALSPSFPLRPLGQLTQPRSGSGFWRPSPSSAPAPWPLASAGVAPAARPFQPPSLKAESLLPAATGSPTPGPPSGCWPPPASGEPHPSAAQPAGTPPGLTRGLRIAGRAGLERIRRRGFRPRPDAELARQLAARGPTIVVTGSRKGGVGKTSFAAGIAIVAGSVLDQIGHRACIVDANIANPDAWGEMHLPPEAATVRETIAALLANREPPPPVHAATPALACYPEVREAGEYSRTAIRRLADHLRRRYTLIVVDMSNRLPDPTAGPEAAVAAYWLEAADVLVLPTTSSRADFNGALDYLEVVGLPPTVVPYIVPDTRRLRDNPTTLEYVKAIRRAAERVVEVPDEANAVRLAGMEGIPVAQLSVRLRLAYRELTEVIVAMPRRRFFAVKSEP